MNQWSTVLALSLVLLALCVPSLAYVDGALPESCYNHEVFHTRPIVFTRYDLLLCPDPCFYQLEVKLVLNMSDIDNVTVSSTLVTEYDCGQIYQVSIKQVGNDAFQGFLVQARDDTVEFTSNSTIYGTWLEHPNLIYRPLNCSRSESMAGNRSLFPNSATHKRRIPATTEDLVVPLYWMPPTVMDDQRPVAFWYTIVQQRATNFLPVKGPVLMPSSDVSDQVTTPNIPTSNSQETTVVMTVLPTIIGFETNESRLREGNAVEVCLVVASGEVTSFISIAIFTGNTEGSGILPDDAFGSGILPDDAFGSGILPDDAFAGRDYNTIPQTDLVLDEILLALSPGDKRVCFQVLSVNNSIPHPSIRQTTFRFRTNTTTINSPIPSHQLYILDDDVNCTQQVSVESRLCVDLNNLSVSCLEPALVCDYLVINCPDMSDELNCPSPLDGLVNLTVNEDNIGMTVSQVSKFANVSANGTLLQTEDFLSDISTVFENVANLVNSSNITVNPTVVSDIVSTLNSLVRWNPESLVVNSTSSVVQSFEVIASTFAQQGNLSVDSVDVSFVAVLAPTDNFRASGSSVDFESQVGLPTSIIIPPTTFNLVPEDRPSVGVFFALYQVPSLFPIVNQIRADNTTTRMRAVGSVVVAATVGPGLTLINIDPPVLITVGLQNPENISQGSESCVSWDFNSQSWITEGCLTMRVGNNVECRCDHLTNFAVLVDVCSRAQDCVSDPTIDKVLEGITLIGVVISCVGLIITIITLLAFRKLREKDNSKYHIQLSIAILCLLIVFATGIDKVQVYGGCIVVSILIHYFSLAAIMWMGAEALLMFQKLVIVFITITKTYIVILSLVCWLVPLIPVLIPMIVDLAGGTTPETDLIITRNMDNETGNITGFCFLQHPGVFFGAFLGPIFAIVLFNLVVFIWVIVILIKHTRGQLKRSNQAVKTKTVIRLVISISGVMFLFGLTWLFGALTFSIAGSNILRDIFRALFVVCASFQGFFIFLFFCVFNTEAREHWKEVLSCGKYRSQSLHPSQYKPPSRVISNNKANTLSTGASSTLGKTTCQSETLKMSVFDSGGSPLVLTKENLSMVGEERFLHQMTTDATNPRHFTLVRQYSNSELLPTTDNMDIVEVTVIQNVHARGVEDTEVDSTGSSVGEIGVEDTEASLLKDNSSYLSTQSFEI